MLREPGPLKSAAVSFIFFLAASNDIFWGWIGWIHLELSVLKDFVILSDILSLEDYTREHWEYSLVQTTETYIRKLYFYKPLLSREMSLLVLSKKFDICYNNCQLVYINT